MTGLEIPTFTDVLAARRRIAPYLRPTPLYRYDGLDRSTLALQAGVAPLVPE